MPCGRTRSLRSAEQLSRGEVTCVRRHKPPTARADVRRQQSHGLDDDGRTCGSHSLSHSIYSPHQLYGAPECQQLRFHAYDLSQIKPGFNQKNPFEPSYIKKICVLPTANLTEHETICRSLPTSAEGIHPPAPHPTNDSFPHFPDTTPKLFPSQKKIRCMLPFWVDSGG